VPIAIECSQTAVPRRGRTSNTKFAVHVRTVAVIIMLILGLLGEGFHHHESAAQCAACPLCAGAVQALVANLAALVTIPVFTTARTNLLPTFHFVADSYEPDARIPRAPPLPNSPFSF
jgi:hypothetical protein